MPKILRRIGYSETYEDYAPFFDHDWANEFVEKGDSAGIPESTEQLVLMWKGASLVRGMSWLMVRGISDSVTTGLYHKDPLSVEVVAAMATKITKQCHLGGVFLDGPTRSGLVREIENVESEVRSNYENSDLKVDPAEMWGDYLKMDEFKLAIWHAELSAFSQLYFAFENFLVQALEEKFGLEGVRADRLREPIIEHFDEELFDRMWGEREIAFARHVRNAITHNGARITPKLESFRDWLMVDDNGFFSIFQKQTVVLYKDLSARAEEYIGIIGEVAEGATGPS